MLTTQTSVPIMNYRCELIPMVLPKPTFLASPLQGASELRFCGGASRPLPFSQGVSHPGNMGLAVMATLCCEMT